LFFINAPCERCLKIYGFDINDGDGDRTDAGDVSKDVPRDQETRDQDNGPTNNASIKQWINKQ
jgi:hypothetical protein